MSRGALRWGVVPLLAVASVLALVGCESEPPAPAAVPTPPEPAPDYRSIGTGTEYVGDEACAGCHGDVNEAYATNTMAHSLHPWTPAVRTETTLAEPLLHAPTGFHYAVIERDDRLYQVEYILGPDQRPLHELARQMDWVMGSGAVARSYFTEENGRLFQLPLTWYADKGWDFSPGYELNNPRFERTLPDGCVACHGSHPERFPFLEAKYAELRSGIGCEQCHGPGALHVAERSADIPPDSAYDDTIVNPAHLPFERRMDVCQQCHVHTPVTVLREGEDAFSFQPSQSLAEHAAFFRAAGDIDIVSHADRLRQSACFVATRPTARPLDCTTCHQPHASSPESESPSDSCVGCHSASDLTERLSGSEARDDHETDADCVRCHMPDVSDRAVPHGTFTDHWIRVVREEDASGSRRGGRGPVEPYFERDRTGPEADLYRAMGEVVFATRSSDAALLRRATASLSEAIDGDTTRGDAHFLLGLGYQQLGAVERALPALRHALRENPEDPERLHAMAQTLERAGRAAEEIEPLYQRALEGQPALAWIRSSYADFLSGEGRIEDAEREYRTALAERPSLHVAAFNLGALLAGRGEREASTEVFQRAVRLDPSLAEALAPLFEVRTRADTVETVRSVGSPLSALPVRSRGPGAPSVTVASSAPGATSLQIVNVPSSVSARILEPDGTLVRVLPPGSSSARVWDMSSQRGVPVPGGLYQVELRGQSRTGELAVLQIWLGLVRVRAG
jgi:tetratricopeptide (TPR) repeat protein